MTVITDNAIKHTNGTTAITINSDGSLSGKFEGAVKFKQIGRPSSGSPASGKTWITFALQGAYYGAARGGWGFGQPVAIGAYNASGSATWTYLDLDTNSNLTGGTRLSSSTPQASDTTEAMDGAGYTYTIEMDNV